MNLIPKLAEIDLCMQTLVIDGVDFPYPILKDGGVQATAKGGELPMITVIIPVESVNIHC